MSWVTRIRNLLPQWATEGEIGKYTETMAQAMDEFQARARAALEIRFPSRAVNYPGAVEKIGRERGIPRGRTETAEHYVERLKRWRSPLGHLVRGNAPALLEQVSEYWGGMYCATVQQHGSLAYTRSPDGTIAVETHPCDWDGDAAQWSRFWVLLYPNPEFPEIKAWPTLGAGAWGSLDPAVNAGKTLGQQGVTPDDVRALRELLYPPFSKAAVAWKPAWTLSDYIVLDLNDRTITAAFNPAGAFGDHYVRWNEENLSGIRFWETRP